MTAEQSFNMTAKVGEKKNNFVEKNKLSESFLQSLSFTKGFLL